MKLYNSLSRSETILELKKTEPFNLYVCGPTVYNYIHLGNARPVFSVDFLVRFLEFEGYQVNYLQNITDIDDKIINKALEQKEPELELSAFFAEQYLTDFEKLNLKMPNKIIKVSEIIPEIILFIEKLLANKSAYLIDGDVYFDIEKYQNEYGKLSGRKLDELIASERLEPNHKKRNPLDFALWKKTKVGLKWDSPFGSGRPGWHTECVVIIDNYFSHQTIDLHAGGIDLKFPHHENERIQFLAANQKEIAKIWMHNGHLTTADEKMSKSLGNVILVKDFLKEHDQNLLRWIFMTTTYTQPLEINEQLIQQGQVFFTKLSNLNKKAKQLFALKQLKDFSTEVSQHQFIEKFQELMNDNLNTSRVLSLIEQIIKQINLDFKENKLTTSWTELKLVLKVLGFEIQLDHFVQVHDQKLFWQWKELVEAKDFDQADKLRDQLIEKGLI